MDLSFRRPFNHSVNDFTNQRSNDFQLGMSKGLPCHVIAVDKDMVTVAFDTKNTVWTPPNMKMPQAFSAYGREPTRVGDKGTAVPSDYYLGGVTGLGGGTADYSPRGNLTALVFHPASNTGTESRDYDQLTMNGGKTGVRIQQGPPAQPSNAQTPAPTSVRRTLSPTSARVLRHAPRRLGRLMPTLTRAALMDANPQPAKQSFMQIDNQGVISHSSKSGDHVITVDENNKKLAAQVPADGQHFVYLGGSGKTPSLYAPVLCAGLVPSVNVMAKITQQDD